LVFFSNHEMTALFQSLTSFDRESGKTHSLKGGPDTTSTVHNLCRRDT
jgi:hypothetical protein